MSSRNMFNSLFVWHFILYVEIMIIYYQNDMVIFDTKWLNLIWILKFNETLTQIKPTELRSESNNRPNPQYNHSVPYNGLIEQRAHVMPPASTWLTQTTINEYVSSSTSRIEPISKQVVRPMQASQITVNRHDFAPTSGIRTITTQVKRSQQEAKCSSSITQQPSILQGKTLVSEKSTQNTLNRHDLQPILGMSLFERRMRELEEARRRSGLITQQSSILQKDTLVSKQSTHNTSNRYDLPLESRIEPIARKVTRPQEEVKCSSTQQFSIQQTNTLVSEHATRNYLMPVSGAELIAKKVTRSQQETQYSSSIANQSSILQRNYAIAAEPKHSTQTNVYGLNYDSDCDDLLTDRTEPIASQVISSQQEVIDKNGYFIEIYARSA